MQFVLANRIIMMPPGGRIFLEQLISLPRHGGGGGRVAEDAETSAVSGQGICHCRVELFTQHGNEIAPAADFPEPAHGLRPIRVVHRQDRRLCKQVGRSEACRVIGIALDLGRTTFVAADQRSTRVTHEWDNGCENTARRQEPPAPALRRTERSSHQAYASTRSGCPKQPMRPSVS